MKQGLEGLWKGGILLLRRRVHRVCDIVMKEEKDTARRQAVARALLQVYWHLPILPSLNASLPSLNSSLPHSLRCLPPPLAPHSCV